MLRCRWGCVAVCVTAFVVPMSANAQSQVRLLEKHGAFQLQYDGNSFQVKGVGGDGQLDLLRSLGGNAIRTWDTDNLQKVLDDAHEHSIKVCVGIWLGHPRHGFDYRDAGFVLEQLDTSLATVEKFKDHPAVLMWAVGNEMEGEGNDPSVWYAVNHMAREIKQIDDNHPTMTVIAEIGEHGHKVRNIERFCPNIDIVGINAYGGIKTLGQRYAAAGGSKPYIVTEHGPLGPWESGRTGWGAPLEWTSTQKAEFYKLGYVANAVNHRDRCLGTFAFLWGHKQETTATWFGMLLPDGRRLGAADALSQLWTGKPPKDRCPNIVGLDFTTPTSSNTVEPGTVLTATVKALDDGEEELIYEWKLLSDSATIGEGGDPQGSESDFSNLLKPAGSKVRFTAPEGGGGYRLFAYVYDSAGGAAVANVPFRVAAPIKLKSVLPVAGLPYSIYEEASTKSVFEPAGFMGNTAALKIDLGCRDSARSGETCIKAQYTSDGLWGGVLWQSPGGAWDGKLPGGVNLTGAKHLEFYARGESGGETVGFVFGVLDGSQPYRDTAKGELKDVKLTKQWQKFSFPLEGLDLRQIKTGFGWTVAGQGHAVTFYLDDIRYVK